MSERFAFPVVSIIVEHPSLPGVILLQQRTKSEAPGLENLFEIPQGRIREGESPIECAIRELREETGLVDLRLRTAVNTSYLRGERLACLTTIVVAETGQHSFFAVCVVGTAEGHPCSSSESSNPRWYNETEVKELISQDMIFPLNVPMLLTYYGGFNKQMPT